MQQREHDEQREGREDEEVRPAVPSQRRGGAASPPRCCGRDHVYLLASSSSFCACGATSSSACFGVFLPSSAASRAGRRYFWSISDHVLTFGSTEVKAPIVDTFAFGR